MLAKFRFLDKETWSYYATLNVLIPLIVFKVLNFKIDSQAMIFMSLLAMMQGDLLPKILFTGFLNFLVFEPNIKWVFKSIIYVISIICFHYIPTDNPINRFIMDYKVIQYILIGIIAVWMYFIMKPSLIWVKNQIII